jgi:hypothetical protein
MGSRPLAPSVLAGLHLAMFIVLGPSIARAEDPATSAELKKSGNEKMLNSDFVGALDDYERAVQLAPGEVALYYNIGRAHGLLGHHPAALAALERFEREAPPQIKARVVNFPELLASIRQHVGYLSVTCPVPAARVLMGSQIVGEAPFGKLAVEAGTAELRIEAEGYRPDARRVTVEAQRELGVACRLLRKESSGTLVVTTTPAGSLVSIDGKVLGNPPLEVPLPAGPHTVGVTRDGYDDASVPVFVSAGAENKRLEIPLQRSVPLTHRWWFWSAAAVIVAGGVVLTAALVTERSADQGTIPPGRIGTPLVRF